MQPALVLVTNFAKSSTQADRVSLGKMEQLLDSNAGGPVPSSVRQKQGKVFVRLDNPADFKLAKSILESKLNHNVNSIFSSISQFSKLYPAVALFIDVSQLSGKKNELVLRNEAFKVNVDSITPLFKQPGTTKMMIFFNNGDPRDYALLGGVVDF